MSEMNEETPKVIYLQPGAGEEGEATWCEDQINDDDIAYVRQDVHEAVIREQTAKTIEMMAERDAANHIIEELENLLNGILQPGELWLDYRREYKGAGENAVEWLSEYGESYGLAEQRVIEGIRAAMKAMVKE